MKLPRYTVHIAAAGLLLAVTAGLYWPVRSHGFITLDDNEYVYENPLVACGLTWEGVRAAWYKNVVGHWHPLTMLSHMVDVEVFGMDAGAQLCVNVCLHITNVLLLYWLAVRSGAAAWVAFALAAVFAVHPLNVEGVAWVSQRKSLLSGLSFFLTLHAYVSYACTRAWRWYAGAVLAYVLGLLCKPMLVSVPVVLVIMDWWPLRRWPAGVAVWRPSTWWSTRDARQWLAEKVPFVILAVGSCVVTFMFQWRSGAVATLSNLGWELRLQNVAMAYCFYLWRLVWPVNLGIGYPLPLRHDSADVFLWCSVLGVLTVAAYAVRRRVPVAWAGWLWYVVMLLPVSSLVQTGYAIVCDRFGYLPLIGTVAGLLGVVAESVRRVPRVRYIALGVMLVPIGLLCFRASGQLAHWRSSSALYEHTLRACGSSPLIHYNLGVAYMRATRYEEAEQQFRAALAMHPTYYAALNNLGNVLTTLKRYREAGAAFRAAAAADPRQAAPWNNLATLRSELGNEADALELYTEALARNPSSPAVNYNIANTYSALRRYDEAIVHYERALQHMRMPFPAHINIAHALLRVGKTEQARQHATRALVLSPDAPPALCLMAICELQHGTVTNAETLLRRALRDNEKYAEAHLYLGTALQRLGDARAAVEHLQRAVELQPGNAEAQNNLGVALSRAGRYHEAVTNLEIAVQAAPWFLEAHLNLALCLMELREYTNAVAVLHAADALSPSNSTVRGTLAWLYATASDRQVRDPQAAVLLAEDAVRLSGGSDPSLLDTLAVCYAVAGDTARANETAKRACEIFLAQGNTNEAQATEGRLRQHLPAREEQNKK